MGKFESSSWIARRLEERTYGELLSIAEALSRHEHHPEALEPTDLVHETWLRLAGQGGAAVRGREHFLALAAREMRRVRVDRARARRAAKRGWGRRRVDLDPSLMEEVPTDSHERLAPALAALAERHPRLATIVQLRWQAGWTVARVARHLGLAPATVEKDSRRALAWLERELSRS